MSNQQETSFQSAFNSPQISLLKNKLIQPTVFYSPEINQSQIDTQKLKRIKRSWTDYGNQSQKKRENTNEKQKKEVSVSASPRNIQQKEKSRKNHFEKHVYILPPVNSIRKLLKNNQSFSEKQQSIVSYLQSRKLNKNQSPSIFQSRIIDQNKINQEQLGQFLKNSKSRERKIIYYQPDQIRKHSLGIENTRKKSSKARQGGKKPQIKLGVSIWLRKQRAKTQLKMSKNIEQVNFFELKTQFASTSDLSFQYLLCKESKKLKQSSLKRGPIVPSREEIKQFLVKYQPLAQEVIMTKMMKSNFCTIQFNKNSVYVGEMIGKVRSGMGLLFTQRSTFEGVWRNNTIEKGAEVTKEGVYKGTFLDQIKQGKGQFQWNNGNIFVGEWSKGVQNGEGLWINPKGESYNGRWKNGKAEGNGLLIIKNTITQKCGKRYKGGFIANKRHGFGRQTFANGDTYEGFYKDDKPDGKGKYSWSNGSVYEGQFCKGLRQGIGILKTLNNSLYTGEFQQDKAEGQCEIKLPNGDVYYGMIKDSKKNGKGTLKLFQTKQVYNGYWKNDFFVRHEDNRK